MVSLPAHRVPGWRCTSQAQVRPIAAPAATSPGWCAPLCRRSAATMAAGTAARAPVHGDRKAAAAAKPTAAAVCPEGNEEPCGRSWTPAWGMSRPGGLRRSQRCLHRFEAASAVIMLVRPERAASRSAFLPVAAINAATAHQSLVRSAADSTAGSNCRARGDFHAARRRVSASSSRRTRSSPAMTAGCPPAVPPHFRHPASTIERPAPAPAPSPRTSTALPRFPIHCIRNFWLPGDLPGPSRTACAAIPARAPGADPLTPALETGSPPIPDFGLLRYHCPPGMGPAKSDAQARPPNNWGESGRQIA